MKIELIKLETARKRRAGVRAQAPQWGRGGIDTFRGATALFNPQAAHAASLTRKLAAAFFAGMAVALAPERQQNTQPEVAGRKKLHRRPTGSQERTRQGFPMLRITTHDNPRALVFRLEGRLEGPWVAELDKCWRDMEADPGRPSLRVDLTGVTFVDAAGKAQLAAMQRQGAKFIADDCVNKAIVAEITHDVD